jgi:DNA repair photolyase
VPELIGIARLAAESPLIEAKRLVEYFDLETRSILAKTVSERVPFRWMINPYRGCEFGCKYCYARYAHEFMELRDPLQFEQKIFAKRFNAPRFREELKKIPPGEPIAIGTATDPYQPAERRYRVTRGILEALAECAGYDVHITTKSDLVARDIDVFQALARRHYFSIHMTVTTVDRELARLIEPMAPRPDLRLNAVRKITSAGLRASVFTSPVMPLINDSDPSLDAAAKAAARAGSHSWGGNVLFLKDCSRQVFIPFLEQHFPLLVRRYRERYNEKTAYLRGDYPQRIHERIDVIRMRYGFDQERKQPEPELWPRELWQKDAQLKLF